MSVMISSLAVRETTPPIGTLPETDTVINKSFTITGERGSPCVGDGNDELTQWDFDFTTHGYYPDFSTLHELEFARLTLMLEPKNALITTDEVWIERLPKILSPLIHFLPVDGNVHTVIIELLDYYCSADILRVLNNNDGKIPMRYQDDAIISYALLELSHPCE